MRIFFAKNREVLLKYDKKEILKNQFIDCSNGAVGWIINSELFISEEGKEENQNHARAAFILLTHI